MESSEMSEVLLSDGGFQIQQIEHLKYAHAGPEGRGDAEDHNEEPLTASFRKNDVLKALKVMERDSMAIAQSFTGLFASLRTTLSEVTSNSVDHMSCFSEAAGRLQECALDAATKGNHYINSSLR
ncbi:unnamed protein product [Cuscuta europaea]|nr:unnamed protein product [Cuscuta europaea]